MLIRLDKSISKFASSNTLGFEELISALFISHTSNFNYVFSDPELKAVSTKTNVANKVSSLATKIQDYFAIEDTSNLVLIIKDQQRDLKRKGKELYISFSFALKNRGKLVSSPYLICENLTDCKIYEHLAKFYYSAELSSLQFNLNFSNGGGGTIFDVINKHHIQNELFLVVVDSDRSCPKCSLGGTAIKAKQTFESLNTDMGALLILEDYREIENLFSLKFYIRCFSKADSRKFDFETHLKPFFEKNKSHYKYYDLKSGLAKNAKCPHGYWKNAEFPAGIMMSNPSKLILEKSFTEHEFLKSSNSNLILHSIYSLGIANRQSLF